MGTPLAHEHRHEHRPDHYEMSFSRSTSNAHGYGPQHVSSGQPSPQGQFFPATSGPGGGGPAYSSRQGPSQGPPHMLPPHPGSHAMPPPPASAPAHQLHFSPYSPRGAPGYAQPPAKRSLSPQPPSRRHLPVPGRFDVGGPQRSPLPFPRIPSPSQHTMAIASSQQPPSTPVKAQTHSSQSPARESSRRLSSVVWGPTGFERLESGMSRCRMCGKEYSKGSSTGTLKRHYRQHQINVAAPNSSNSAGANPYARPSPPVNAHAPSRPRAYSHRTDMRSRREMSPFSPVQQHSYAIHQQPPPSAALPRTQGPPQPPVHTQPPPMFVVRRSDPTEVDTSSAIAGSALLSMAAGGDARVTVDTGFETIRRPMRSSDPSVYPHGAGSSNTSAHARASAGAAEPGTRDISVSPSPSSSATHSRSPSPTTLTHSNYSLVEPSAGVDTGHVMHMHSLAIGSAGNFNEADEDMDVEDDDEDDDEEMEDSHTCHPHNHMPHHPRRRATITGVQRIPLPSAPAVTGVPTELAREIGSLSATQLVALSSELVRRVATALPLLAQEAERKLRLGEPPSGYAQNGGGSLSCVEDPLEVLFGHIKASLLECDPSLLGSSTLHSSCDLPFTIRRPVVDNSTVMTSTSGLLARVSASMQRIAPLSLAELDWDNVGILL
ncbi:hypothetical protein H4S07_004348, partial [Coemansia furcata]